MTPLTPAEIEALKAKVEGHTEKAEPRGGRPYSSTAYVGSEADANLYALAPQLLATVQHQAAQLAKFGWQPIATAPKTGPCKDILLFVPGLHGTKGVVVGHWADGGGEDQPRFRGWFMWSGYDFIGLRHDPTHWMPLPSVPASLRGDATDAEVGK